MRFVRVLFGLKRGQNDPCLEVEEGSCLEP